jgi:hypothetical protein
MGERIQQKCAWCKKVINPDSFISFVDRGFCSDACQLRFYKEELPNMGGSAITDEDIKNVGLLSGDERRDLIEDIFNRTMEGLESGKIMQGIRDMATTEEDVYRITDIL